MVDQQQHELEDAAASSAPVPAVDTAVNVAAEATTKEEMETGDTSKSKRKSKDSKSNSKSMDSKNNNSNITNNKDPYNRAESAATMATVHSSSMLSDIGGNNDLKNAQISAPTPAPSATSMTVIADITNNERPPLPNPISSSSSSPKNNPKNKKRPKNKKQMEAELLQGEIAFQASLNRMLRQVEQTRGGDGVQGGVEGAVQTQQQPHIASSSTIAASDITPENVAAHRHHRQSMESDDAGIFQSVTLEDVNVPESSSDSNTTSRTHSNTTDEEAGTSSSSSRNKQHRNPKRSQHHSATANNAPQQQQQQHPYSHADVVRGVNIFPVTANDVNNNGANAHAMDDAAADDASSNRPYQINIMDHVKVESRPLCCCYGGDSTRYSRPHQSNNSSKKNRCLKMAVLTLMGVVSLITLGAIATASYLFLIPSQPDTNGGGGSVPSVDTQEKPPSFDGGITTNNNNGGSGTINTNTPDYEYGFGEEDERHKEPVVGEGTDMEGTPEMGGTNLGDYYDDSDTDSETEIVGVRPPTTLLPESNTTGIPSDGSGSGSTIVVDGGTPEIATPQDAKRLEDIRTILVAQDAASDASFLEDKKSPNKEYQALQWLAYEDPLQLTVSLSADEGQGEDNAPAINTDEESGAVPPTLTLTSEERIIQRFSARLLYLELSVDKAHVEHDPEGEQDEIVTTTSLRPPPPASLDGRMHMKDRDGHEDYKREQERDVWTQHECDWTFHMPPRPPHQGRSPDVNEQGRRSGRGGSHSGSSSNDEDGHEQEQEQEGSHQGSPQGTDNLDRSGNVHFHMGSHGNGFGHGDSDSDNRDPEGRAPPPSSVRPWLVFGCHDHEHPRGNEDAERHGQDHGRNGGRPPQYANANARVITHLDMTVTPVTIPRDAENDSLLRLPRGMERLSHLTSLAFRMEEGHPKEANDVFLNQLADMDLSLRGSSTILANLTRVLMEAPHFGMLARVDLAGSSGTTTKNNVLRNAQHLELVGGEQGFFQSSQEEDVEGSTVIKNKIGIVPRQVSYLANLKSLTWSARPRHTKEHMIESDNAKDNASTTTIITTMHLFDETFFSNAIGHTLESLVLVVSPPPPFGMMEESNTNTNSSIAIEIEVENVHHDDASLAYDLSWLSDIMTSTSVPKLHTLVVSGLGVQSSDLEQLESQSSDGGTSTLLQHLDLSNNALQGTVPSWLTSTVINGNSKLRHLDLHGNLLTGSVLDDIMVATDSDTLNASALEYLDLSNNALMGPFPGSLGHDEKTHTMKSFPHLTTLKLQCNSLEGALPSDFGLNFPALQQLLLSDNQLTGTVPPSFADMTHLVHLQLFGNSNLTGNMDFACPKGPDEDTTQTSTKETHRDRDRPTFAYLVDGSSSKEIDSTALTSSSRGGVSCSCCIDVSRHYDNLLLVTDRDGVVTVMQEGRQGPQPPRPGDDNDNDNRGGVNGSVSHDNPDMHHAPPPPSGIRPSPRLRQHHRPLHE